MRYHRKGGEDPLPVKNLPLPAPTMFAKFAEFTNFNGNPNSTRPAPRSPSPVILGQ